MKTALPFLEVEAPAARVRVWFGEDELELPEGANLAAALLAAGVGVFRRNPVSGAPRGPFCMMGACFDCLVEIDGIQRQACMVEVVKGLRIGPAREAEANDAPD